MTPTLRQRLARAFVLLLAGCVLLAACLLAPASFEVIGAEPTRVPVIYSTDLLHPHDDPDDHFDLACLYAMSEADLRGIVLDQGQEQVRRSGLRAVHQLNHLTGRNVPAAIGLREKLKTPDDKAEDQPPEHQQGVRLILQSLRQANAKVAIQFVGSARDIVAACNREPALFRQKVRSIHGFIGEAGNPTNIEWNVSLDPQAFVALMRAELPFFWIPCFDGGLWQNRGHASFWRVAHSQVVGRAPEPLLRYFLYMLRKETNDPIAYLSQPMEPDDRAWLMRGDRNLWCGALLGLAVGRPLRHENRDVAGFAPVEARVDEKGVVTYGDGAGSRTVQRFEIKDRDRFEEAATRATASLLETFPMRPAR